MLKRKIMSLVISSSFVCSMLPSMTVSAVERTVSVNPSATAFSHIVSGTATVTTGGEMRVSRNGSGSVVRNSYMMFDIGSVTEDITKAELILNVNLAAQATGICLSASSYDVVWPQEITAETLPAIPENSVSVIEPTEITKQDTFYEQSFDITSYIQSLQSENKTEASLVFTGSASTQIVISGMNAPARCPVLKLTYDDGLPTLQKTLNYDFSDYAGAADGTADSFFKGICGDAVAADAETGSYRTIKPAAAYAGKADDDISVMMESHLYGEDLQMQKVDGVDSIVEVTGEEEYRKLFMAGPYLDNGGIPFRWNLQNGAVTHLSFDFAYEGGANYRRFLIARMRNSSGTTYNIVPFWTEGNRVYCFKRQALNIKLEEGSWNSVDIFLWRDKSFRIFVNDVEADIRDYVTLNDNGSYKLINGANEDNSDSLDVFNTMVGFRFGYYERVAYEEDTKTLIDDICIKDMYEADATAEAASIIQNGQKVKFASVFGNDMVLQRNKPIKVWGYAPANAQVKVTLGQNESTVNADENGKWTAEFAAMAEQNGLTLSAQNTADENDKAEFKNIAVGEVILCGGQSNMQYILSGVKDADTVIAEADNYDIRVLDPGDRQGEYYALDENPQFSWIDINSQNAGNVTAVGYLTAMNLIKNGSLNCAVGIINFNRSGSQIQAWLDMDTIEARDIYAEHKTEFEERKSAMTLLRNNAESKATATTLYNAMLSPIKDLQLGGILWYQGESNSNNAQLYKYQLADYINLMRAVFDDGELPFVMFSLAPYNTATAADWGEIRQIQLDTAKRIDNIALVSTATEGPTGAEGEDPIHPMNKLPLGERAAKAYGAIALGEEGEWQGPVYDSVKIDGNKAVLSFTHIGDGLAAADGQALTGFTISADGESFVEATAVIAGSTIEVTGVDEPVEVRYCYGTAVDENGSLGGNLTNSTGIPALPFRASKEAASIYSVSPSAVTADELKNGITIQLTADNSGYTAASQKVVVAVYEDNRLVSCKVYDTEAATVDRKTYKLPFAAELGVGAECKVMLMDDFSNIKPFGYETIQIN